MFLARSIPCFCQWSRSGVTDKHILVFMIDRAWEEGSVVLLLSPSGRIILLSCLIYIHGKVGGLPCLYKCCDECDANVGNTHTHTVQIEAVV